MKDNKTNKHFKRKVPMDNPILETFGILKGKFKTSTKQLLEESDKECWDE